MKTTFRRLTQLGDQASESTLSIERTPAVLASRLTQYPLAITAEGFRAFADRIRALPDALRSAQSAVSSEMQIGFEDFFTPRPAMSVGPDGIAQVALCGVIAPGMPGIFEKLLGNTDSQTFRSEMLQCAGDAKIRGVLMNVDSPGGSTVGHDECRSAVMAVRSAGKPVLAYVHGESCSAAYGPTAMADFVYCSESSILGNIGSILTRLDWSAWGEQMGIKPEVFASDELKATFADELQPTSAAQAAFVQEFVKTSADRFKQSVAAARPQIATEDMAGQWYWAPEAVAKGFADFITTPQKAYADLLGLL